MKSQTRPVSAETVETLKQLLRDAQTGKVIGLAVASLHASGKFDLCLRGAAVEEGNQMGVAGMLAALQKMTLELY